MTITLPAVLMDWKVAPSVWDAVDGSQCGGEAPAAGSRSYSKSSPVKVRSVLCRILHNS